MKHHDYTRLGGFLLFFQVISILYLLYLVISVVSSLSSGTSDFATNVEYSMNIIFCLLNIYFIGISDCRFRTFYLLITFSGSFYLLALTLVASYISEIDFAHYLGRLISYCIIRGFMLLYLYRSKRAAVYFNFVNSAPSLVLNEEQDSPSSESLPTESISESSSIPSGSSQKSPVVVISNFLSSIPSERRAFIKGILCTVLILLIAIGAFFGVKAYKIYLRSVYDDGFIDGLKTGYNQGAKDAYPEYSYTYRSAYTAGFVDSQNGNLFNSDPPIQNNP